jgi:hypothetical protein
VNVECAEARDAQERLRQELPISGCDAEVRLKPAYLCEKLLGTYRASPGDSVCAGQHDLQAEQGRSTFMLLKKSNRREDRNSCFLPSKVHGRRLQLFFSTLLCWWVGDHRSDLKFRIGLSGSLDDGAQRLRRHLRRTEEHNLLLATRQGIQCRKPHSAATRERSH